MIHENSSGGFHREYGRSEMGLIPATREIMKKQGIPVLEERAEEPPKGEHFIRLVK
jgi:hypothetical protein